MSLKAGPISVSNKENYDDANNIMMVHAVVAVMIVIRVITWRRRTKVVTICLLQVST